MSLVLHSLSSWGKVSTGLQDIKNMGQSYIIQLPRKVR